MAEAAHERAEVEPDQADQEPDNEASARNDIITRAMSWVTTSPKIAYNQRETHPNEYGTHRTDCSGFVSIAWGPSTQPDTSRLPDFATRIDPRDLQKGDILLNDTATDPNNRHVVTFEGWADEAKTYYWGIEHRPGGPERDKIPFPYYAKDRGGRSLEPEKYDPYRYNKLRGTAR